MRLPLPLPAALLSFCSIALTPVLALAADWTGTFPPGAAASYFGGVGHSVLVVASGGVSDEREAATKALSTSLRESSSFPLVMDGAALGDLSDLDDGAIVQKASHLPIARIAVVRVFAGSAGAEPTALVTIYRKDGSALNGFSAKPGTALVASSEDAGSGLNRGVAETVSTISSDSAKSKAAASEEFDQNFIWFQEVVTVNAQNGSVMGSTAIPLQGKYRKPLEGAAFYEAIDRPDLASSYRTRQIVRGSLIGVGVAGIVGGALAPLYASDENRWTTMGAVLGGGVVLALVGGSIDGHPIPATEARRLADEHNSRLKERLGLASRDASAPKKIKAGLFATREGGGVTLGGSF